MQTHTPRAGIEDRLATIEIELRKARRQAALASKIAGVLALLMFGGLGIAAMSPNADVLAVRRLEIHDDNGKLVFAASSTPTGGQLDLWTPAGDNILRLSANEQGGDLAVWNRKGGNVFGAFATAEGAELGLWNAGGSQAVRLQGREVGGEVRVANHLGMTAFTATATASGGRAMVTNSTGRPAGELTSAERGGEVVIYATDGQPVLRHGVNDNGGEVVIRNTKGVMTAISRATEVGGEFLASNNTGSPVFAAGPSDDGTGTAVLADAGGTPRWRGHVTNNGGVLDMLNHAGKIVYSGSADSSGSGMLKIANSEGMVAIQAFAAAGAGGRLAVSGPNGPALCQLGVGEHGGLLTLVNKYGVPVITVGAASENRAGSVTVNNGRGLGIGYIGAGDAEEGVVSVWNEEGKKVRHVRPVP